MATVIRIQRFVRNREAGDLLEAFFISAVSAIILTRFYLHLTNYPQFGGRGVHIAHVLPGGIFMLVAMVLMFSYLNRGVKMISAILGGIGFGLFIDELGKFLTSDTNYFFEPTFTLMYVLFVVLFFAFRALGRFQKLNDQENLLNALELTKDVAIHDLDEEEKERVLTYLKDADQHDPVVQALTKAFRGIKPIKRDSIPAIIAVRRWLADRYRALVDTGWFRPVIVAVFVFGAAGVLARTVVGVRFDDWNFTFVELGRVIPSTVSALLVLAGAVSLARSRVIAYELFRLALLVGVFITQLFVFYENQLSGVIVLAGSLLGLVTIQYMLSQERRLHPTR